MDLSVDKVNLNKSTRIGTKQPKITNLGLFLDTLVKNMLENDA